MKQYMVQKLLVIEVHGGLGTKQHLLQEQLRPLGGTEDSEAHAGCCSPGLELLHRRPTSREDDVCSVCRDLIENGHRILKPQSISIGHDNIDVTPDKICKNPDSHHPQGRQRTQGSIQSPVEARACRKALLPVRDEEGLHNVIEADDRIVLGDGLRGFAHHKPIEEHLCVVRIRKYQDQISTFISAAAKPLQRLFIQRRLCSHRMRHKVIPLRHQCGTERLGPGQVLADDSFHFLSLYFPRLGITHSPAEVGHAHTAPGVSLYLISAPLHVKVFPIQWEADGIQCPNDLIPSALLIN
mmetsp:Transcript_44989/g.97724  ORF Transcript_44989/g.97724 Transcript_44989/m.97724 type:complete len:297 (-) Transcript_44989:774-1664(-)